MDHKQLLQTLKGLNGRGYKAYKQIKGSYQFPRFRLQIDHIQGDPFAAASKMRVFISLEEAGFHRDFFSGKSRQIALEDFLTREFYRWSKIHSKGRGTGKSGLITIDAPGQQVISRTSCLIHNTELEVRFVVGLPAEGRTILGHHAVSMLGTDLPAIVQASLYLQNLEASKIWQHVKVNEDADFIRNQLAQRSLIAFIADGSILPRKSGVDDRPLETDVIPFESPDRFSVTFDCPNRGKVTGMGIPKGITLIVGGGYHGKSTILKALEKGVYNHIPGDGREYCIADESTVKIKSEEGRSVTSVRISPFINNLPFRCRTDHFSTTNASGSTSQAANMIESIEVGCGALLVDEDTSATNFMIRDARMQALIHQSSEPITPFTDKIRPLYDELGISTVLVMGGSGDYFEHADQVIALEQYRLKDLTNEAKKIAEEFSTGRINEGGVRFGSVLSRKIEADGFSSRFRNKEPYLKTRGLDEIQFGQQCIDLSSVDQLVNESQLRGIVVAMDYARRHLIDGDRTISKICQLIHEKMRKDEEGFQILTPLPDGDLAYFRPYELAAAINRLRSLQISH